MPSDLDNLKTRRSAIAAELAALVSKPTYSNDSRSVQWQSHRKSLLDEYQQINELINALEPAEYSITGTP